MYVFENNATCTYPTMFPYKNFSLRKFTLMNAILRIIYMVMVINNGIWC